MFLMPPLLKISGSVTDEENEGQVVSRTDFPSDFIFGVATSAYQVRHQTTMHIHHSLHFVLNS
jgi:hypothetical protein